MKLIRLALLTFTPYSKDLDSWEIHLEGVALTGRTVRESNSDKNTLRLLVEAEIPIEFPEIDDEGCVLIPKEPRKKCEQAIEKAPFGLSRFSGMALVTILDEQRPDLGFKESKSCGVDRLGRFFSSGKTRSQQEHHSQAVNDCDGSGRGSEVLFGEFCYQVLSPCPKKTPDS